MGSKVDVPATTDPTSTDWQNFIAWVEKAQTGKINITFSEMDSTDEPKIQAGSIVEIAGSLYSFSAEEEATGWGDIDDSTQAYMALTASGDTVSAEWTDTAPTYRDDLQGWYESGTNKRYVLASYKDSPEDYTVKVKITNVFYGDNTFSGDNTFTDNPNLSGDGKLAGFYTSTTSNESEYPIGTVLFVVKESGGGTVYNRNSSIGVYRGSPSGTFEDDGTEAEQLNGTWRARGVITEDSTYILAQRVS